MGLQGPENRKKRNGDLGIGIALDPARAQQKRSSEKKQDQEMEEDTRFSKNNHSEEKSCDLEEDDE